MGRVAFCDQLLSLGTTLSWFVGVLARGTAAFLFEGHVLLHWRGRTHAVYLFVN